MTNSYFRLFLGLALGFGIFVLGWCVVASGFKTCTAIIGGAPVQLEIASTQAVRSKGLSGRQRLEPNQGMLFLFPEISKPHFTMLDTYISLDILFVRDEKILAMYTAPAYTDDKSCFYCEGPECNEVIEVNSGFCNKHGIKFGDSISITPDFRIPGPREVFERFKILVRALVGRHR